MAEGNAPCPPEAWIDITGTPTDVSVEHFTIKRNQSTGLVVVNGYLSIALNNGLNYIYGIVDSNYRPSTEVALSIFVDNQTVVYAYISISGNLVIRASSSVTSTNIRFSGCYVK